MCRKHRPLAVPGPPNSSSSSSSSSSSGGSGSGSGSGSRSLRELVGANERHPEDRRVRKRLESRLA